MIHLSDRFVVILDANVLYPFRKRDILLRFYEAGLFRAHWTDEITDEWTRRLIANKPALEPSIMAQLGAMRTAFPEAVIENYQQFTNGLKLPDPGDRHVLAAAIQCGAQHIVTENLRDFPIDLLKDYGIEAIDTDEFLIRTFELYPGEALAVLRQLRIDYQNPSLSVSELIMDLFTKGLPKLSARLRTHRARL